MIAKIAAGRTDMALTRRGVLAAAGALALLRSELARAAEPPVLKLVVPFAAGSAPDLIARLLAQAWRRPAAVINMPGAGGNLGVDHVAKAQPDGYTLVLAGDAALVVNPSLYEAMPFDPQRDLTPLSQIAVTPNVLVVAGASPFNSVADLVAAARQAPGRLTFASAGAGTSSHRSGEWLKRAAAIDIAHVPYRTSFLPDVVSGTVSFTFANVATAMPMIREGRLRALAAGSRTRLDDAPDLPTMIELGYGDFESVAWFGLLAPAGLSEGMIIGLQAELAVIGADPDVRKKLSMMGADPIFGTREALASLIITETLKWSSLMRRTGIRLQ
jgi:tripartite-type tricarboxylate transporter receptor subunit TctC